MLGWGLNIVVGLAGLLDLGYVAFYAVGAYSYALLSTTFGLSFWICLPLAGLLAAMWGVILGFPVLRLRGDDLAIVTLAFGEIIRMVLINWVDLTNGYAGISEIRTFPSSAYRSRTTTTGSRRSSTCLSRRSTARLLFYLILALALLTNFVTIRLRRLPIGRAWQALREDEIACRSLGINTTNTKLTAFALGAMFGGFAGSFFAVRQGFVSPESFTFIELATILAIVVLGGMGSQLGVAVAAAVMIGVPELMRELDWMKKIFGEDFDPTQYRMLLFGAAMVIMMIWKPRGLVSTRLPSIFLKESERPCPAISSKRDTGKMNWLTGPLLAVENLTMRFGGLIAVNAFSFSVGRGDITALIGPNGAGKTTVFNCVTGFYKPTEGRLALARDGVATPEDIAAVTRSSGRHATTANGELFSLERMPDHEIARKARCCPHLPEHTAFPGDDHARKPAGRPSQSAYAGERPDGARIDRRAELPPKRGRLHRQDEILAREDWAHGPGRRPGGRTALWGSAPT